MSDIFGGAMMVLSVLVMTNKVQLERMKVLRYGERKGRIAAESSRRYANKLKPNHRRKSNPNPNPNPDPNPNPNSNPNPDPNPS